MKNEDLMNNFYKAAQLIGRGFLFQTRGAHPGMPNHARHNPGQGKLLALISEVQPVSQKDLVEKLDIRPSSLSELLKKLEAKGLIERKQDEQDKRNMIVSLTGKGREAAKDAGERKNELSKKMFGALTEEECEQLNTLLEKLISAWQEDFSGREDCAAGRHDPRFGHMGPGFHPHHRKMHYGYMHCEDLPGRGEGWQ